MRIYQTWFSRKDSPGSKGICQMAYDGIPRLGEEIWVRDEERGIERRFRITAVDEQKATVGAELLDERPFPRT